MVPTAAAQEVTLRGFVRDAPLRGFRGANVTLRRAEEAVRGASAGRGAAADADGFYQITSLLARHDQFGRAKPLGVLQFRGIGVLHHGIFNLLVSEIV